MTGRPTKLTAETEARILDAIRVGATYHHAAGAAGITEQTLITWRQRGEREPNSRYGRFLEQVKMAEGRAVVQWLTVMDGLPQGWQAMAWKLERRHNDDYGQKKDATPQQPIIINLPGGADTRADSL